MPDTHEAATERIIGIKAVHALGTVAAEEVDGIIGGNADTDGERADNLQGEWNIKQCLACGTGKQREQVWQHCD